MVGAAGAPGGRPRAVSPLFYSRAVPTEEESAAYDTVRQRVVALTTALDRPDLGRTVGCCPAWTVQELLGHLTGLLEDRRDGRLPGDGDFGRWTDAQVARHRGEPVAETAALWTSLPVTPDESAPSIASLAFDAVTHEFDMYEALGLDGDHHSDAVRMGAQRAEGRMGAMLAAANIGVALTIDGATRTVGAAAPAVRLETTPFDLMRLVTGRMSDGQARALEWTGDPSDTLAALFADSFFTLQPRDVTTPFA